MVEAQFTVNLLAPIPESVRTTVALQLAEKFNVSIAKMNRLLRNNQGPITKPISQRDALKIAKVLGRAGIEVAVVRSDLNESLLIAEEPLVSREDRMELRELLLAAPDTSLPEATRLEEPALASKPVAPPVTPKHLTPPNIASLVTPKKTSPGIKASVPSKRLGRPIIVAGLSLLFVVLTVAFGVSFMLPERPFFPGQEQLPPFEKGMAAYTSGDYPKALELWQAQAEQGDVKAQFELAWLYTNGLGTTKDLAKAASYFSQAAEGGYVEAQNKLGQLYLYGQGVSQDHSQAIKWLIAAAEQGWGEAQLTLGQLYLKGEAGEVNLIEADKWLNLAASQGVTGANEALTDLMRLQAVAEVGRGSANMFTAVEQDDPQAVIGAVLAGADVNARSQDGYTPLMYAVARGNAGVIQEVLSGGADINAQSSTGWTALMFAAKGNSNAIEILLKAGANKTLKNDAGQNAYDIALAFQPSSAELLNQ